MAESATSFSRTNQPANRGKRGPGKKTIAQNAFASLGYSPIECQILIAKQLMINIEERSEAGHTVAAELDTLIKINAKLIEFETPRPAAEVEEELAPEIVAHQPLSTPEIMAAEDAMKERLLK